MANTGISGEDSMTTSVPDAERGAPQPPRRKDQSKDVTPSPPTGDEEPPLNGMDNSKEDVGHESVSRVQQTDSSVKSKKKGSGKRSNKSKKSNKKNAALSLETKRKESLKKITKKQSPHPSSSSVGNTSNVAPSNGSSAGQPSQPIDQENIKLCATRFDAAGPPLNDVDNHVEIQHDQAPPAVPEIVIQHAGREHENQQHAFVECIYQHDVIEDGAEGNGVPETCAFCGQRMA